MSSPETPGTPSRPAVPQYGEYAEPGDPRVVPAYTLAPPPVVPAVTKAPRRRDALASAMLLGLGFVSTVYTVLFALDLEAGLRQAFITYGGTGDYDPAGNLGLARAVLITSHVVLLAAAILLTRSLVRANRVSFWVPLVAGAIASIVFFITLGALLAGDAALLNAAMEFTNL